MCKVNKKWGDTRIDPCMRGLIKGIYEVIMMPHLDIVACCCGHKKYHMTIVVKNKSTDLIIELVSGVILPRKRRFYRKDKQGYYYIPEVENAK